MSLVTMNTMKPLIKPGWLRALIYFIVIAVVGFGMHFINQLVSVFIQENINKSLVAFISFFTGYSILAIVIILITLLFLKFIDRQSLKTIGFATSDYGNEAGLGFFIPLFLLGAGTLILIATQNLSMTGAMFDPLSFVLQLILMIVVAFTEELMFRGYLLNNLMQSMNKWAALILSALLFVIFHLGNPDITWVALVNILLAGLLLGLNYVYTRNLWYGIVFHFTWNFFQGPVMGYDVSGLKLPGIMIQVLTGPKFFTGGLFGFEGSFVCLVLLLVTIIIFYFVFQKRYETIK